MKYHLKNRNELKDCIERVKTLARAKRYIELREIRTSSLSHPMRSYLHVLLDMIAMIYGERLDYVKEEFYKRRYNEDIFEDNYSNKNGKVRWFLKSSEKISDAEYVRSIENLRHGFMKDTNEYLPDANEDLSKYQYEIEKHKNRSL